MKKVLCLLLTLLLLSGTLVGCSGKEDENGEGTGTLSVTAEDKYSDLPDIPVGQFGGDFNILYPETQIYQTYYFAEDYTGIAVSDANYRRQMNIEEHLGVKLKFIAGGEHKDIATKISTTAMSGDDSYQMALTHCYIGVLGMAMGDYLLDYQDIEYVDLDAEWWNKSQMKQVNIEGKLYFGTNSFIFHEPNVILFNKTIANQYPDIGADALYEHVENKTWTLEQMKVYASRISVDSNDDSKPEEGTYGFTSQLDFELCAFMAVNDYYIADSNGDGTYTLKKYNQTIENLYSQIKGLMDQKYSYGWKWSKNQEGAIKIDTGRTFFTTASLPDCITYTIEKKVSIGILPYPTLEEGRDYQMLDWAGFVVIPSSVAKPEVSGAVAELLAYYGEKDLKTEFYDVLLGTRSADNLKDSEMLDLIFDSLVCDPGMNLLNVETNAMAQIFYAIPRAIKSGEGGLSSWFGTYYNTAKNALNFDLY